MKIVYVIIFSIVILAAAWGLEKLQLYLKLKREERLIKLSAEGKYNKICNCGYKCRLIRYTWRLTDKESLVWACDSCKTLWEKGFGKH